MTPVGTQLGGRRDRSYCIIEMNGDGTDPLEIELSQAIAKIAPHKDILDQVTSSGGIISFFIGWFSQNDSGGKIELRTLRKLCNLNINLDINVYCCREIESEGEIVKES